VHRTPIAAILMVNTALSESSLAVTGDAIHYWGIISTARGIK